MKDMRDSMYGIAIIGISYFTGLLICKNACLKADNKLLLNTLEMATRQIEHMNETWEPKKN